MQDLGYLSVLKQEAHTAILSLSLFLKDFSDLFIILSSPFVSHDSLLRCAWNKGLLNTFRLFHQVFMLCSVIGPK